MKSTKPISITLEKRLYEEVEKEKNKRKFKSTSRTINVLLEELFEIRFKKGFEVNNEEVNKNG